MTAEHSVERVEVRGTELRLLQAGEGSPLLYLHGSGDRGAWLPVFDTLAQTHTVYRPDHPGFGHSAADERIDSVHELSFFYLDLLDELGLDRVSVIGGSFGGWIAADLATIEPRRLEKLVLIGASGLRVEGVEQPDIFTLSAVQLAQLTFHRPELREQAVADAAALETDPERLQLYLQNRVGTAHLAWNPYFHDPQLLHRLHRAIAPTLVVWGSDDRIVPLAHGERWVELLPNARFEVVGDAGHLPHVEQPERFLELVTPFLGAPLVAARQ